MINDEAALLADVRFAARPRSWPPKGSARPSEDYARRVVEHLKLRWFKEGKWDRNAKALSGVRVKDAGPAKLHPSDQPQGWAALGNQQGLAA